jgi:DNA-binding beta-propeller fold protein YncE
MARRRIHGSSIALLLAFISLFCSSPVNADRAAESHRFLYVAVPGVRNYVEHGGVGILVYDIDDGHRLVKRIPTLPQTTGEEVEAVKGICASAPLGRVYVSTPKRLFAIDLKTDKMVWNRTYPGGCDRMSISPDGKMIYVPSLEGPHWNVVDAETGDLKATINTDSGAHNTVFGSDGRFVYLAGLKSPELFVADARTHSIAKTVGPFGNVIRPLTVNRAQSLCFVNVNDLLGFEVGDLRTGKPLHRVVVPGAVQGPTKRHGCPSHGVALTPDEKQLWLTDAANSTLHIFDATTMPPKWVAKIVLRDQPGWITFSIDGKFAYPSTGEVIDPKTREIVGTLADENGQPVQSEKMMEIDFHREAVTHVGDQFGVGRKR